jgi:polyhydroxyalkanoate synthesis regulator phasin
MIEETSIKHSLNDEEIREYLQEVMNQIRPKNNGK